MPASRICSTCCSVSGWRCSFCAESDAAIKRKRRRILGSSGARMVFTSCTRTIETQFNRAEKARALRETNAKESFGDAEVLWRLFLEDLKHRFVFCLVYLGQSL